MGCLCSVTGYLLNINLEKYSDSLRATGLRLSKNYIRILQMHTRLPDKMDIDNFNLFESFGKKEKK